MAQEITGDFKGDPYPETRPGRGLGKSLGWSLAQVFGVFTCTGLVRLLLAGRLPPEAFGGLGLSLSALALLHIVGDLGLGAALVQRQNLKESRALWSTVFWSQLLLIVLMGAVLGWGVAPLMENSLSVPGLTQLVRMFVLAAAIHGLGYVSRIRLQRALEFRPEAIATLCGVIFGGAAALVLAWRGGGMEIFGIQALISAAVSLLVVWFAAPFVPGTLPNFVLIRTFMRYGAADTGMHILGYIHHHFNTLAMGVLFSSVQVGWYTLAHSFTLSLAEKVQSAVTRVLFPFSAQHQNDLPTLRLAHLRQIRLGMFCFSPLWVSLVVFSPAALQNISGSDWSGAAGTFQALGLFLLLFQAGGTPALWLRAKGQMRKAFHLQALRFLLVKPPLVLGGGFLWGYPGFLAGLVLSQFTIYLVDFFYLRKTLALNFPQHLLSALPALLSAWLAVPASVWLLRVMHTGWPRFLAAFVLLCASHALLLLFWEKYFCPSTERSVSLARTFFKELRLS